MANEQLESMLTTETPAESRRLRRRASDGVIGGVAAGVADFLNVDPLLVRAAFAGLMIFAGAGLVLYVVAWLLIPAQDRDDSIVDSMLARVGLRSRNTGTAILVFLVVTAAGAWLNGFGPGQRYRGATLTGLAIITLGIVLLRWNDMPWNARSRRPAASASANAVPDPGAWSGRMPEARPTQALPRERSPLGWYVLAATLVTVGTLAIVGNLPGVRVAPGQYFGVVLAVVGLGLVLGAWWGRARQLVVLGLLLVPVAVPAALVTVPLNGGIGDVEYRPQNLGELRGEYRLAGGDLRLDLRDLRTGGAPTTITASVGFGRLILVIPDDVPVELDAHAAYGWLKLFGNQQAGTSLGDRVERPGNPTSLTGRLVLNLEVGIGTVIVESARAGGS